MKSLTLSSIKACLLALSFFSLNVFAHEGHGDHDTAMDGVLHWFTEWDHLVVLAIAVGIVVLLFRNRTRSNKNKNLQQRNDH